ncbi:competence protein CoiA [Lactobacillus psittaci]|uniref:Competence protein n=1 Tax=Lactobacillus psittaci DSM 15354 TaxID=1122152 RepID=A0A0R1SBC0_9LACO|nr:competence protein CoiA family protein [Lactobacillus psittaci]KRL63858.1 competence protein [Lactobacillus psittaci DSM 15354]
MYAALLNKKLVSAVEEAILVQKQVKRLNYDLYRCPKCNKKVVLIISENKNAFFKHYRSAHQAGEKEEHLQSKLLMKTALTAAGFKAKTEVSLSENELRADILASSKLAIEIQCAPLNEQEFTHRHQLYQKLGILDLWIVGKRHYLKEKLKKTQVIFFRRNEKWGTYLIEIDPWKAILRLKYQIMLAPISNKVFFLTQIFPLDDLGLVQLWKFEGEKFKYQLNPLIERQYLAKQLQQKTNLGLRLGQELYLNKLSIEQLPDEIFLNLRNINEVTNLEQYLKKKAFT